MSAKRVTLEQTNSIPEASWDLPRDELYVQLGCSACASPVCFTAKGITAAYAPRSRYPDEAQTLDDHIREVEKKSTTHRGFGDTWGNPSDDPCDDPCPQLEDVSAIVDLLNEEFGAKLIAPSQG